MMACSKVTRSAGPVLGFTISVLGPTKTPRPCRYRILRLFVSWPRPPVSLPTTPSFQAVSLAMSMEGLPKLTPMASASRASLTTRAACKNAFDGMQPR